MVKIGKVVNTKKYGRQCEVKGDPYDAYIICYKLTKKDINLICKKTNKKIDFNLIDTNEIVDCIAFACDLVIINTDKLSGNDIKIINECEEAVDNAILIGKRKIKLKKSKAYDSIEKFISNIKFSMMSKRKERKKRAEFSTQIHHVLSVLKLILNKPYITTQEIADKLEINKRTVIRNIETLRELPENICYDKTKGGWYIEKNFSFLLSDIKKEIKE